MTESPTGRGRPRSERARRAILDSAYEVLLRDGPWRASVDAIAAGAGVSKATIYRWWPRKSALVLEAMLDHNRATVQFPHTGDVRADLEHELRSVIRFFSTGAAGAAMLQIVAASTSDAALASDLSEQIIEPVCAAARERIAAGVVDGQLRADLDLDLTIELLWGPVYYRFLVAHRPPDPSYAAAVLDQVWPAIAAAPVRTGAR